VGPSEAGRADQGDSCSSELGVNAWPAMNVSEVLLGNGCTFLQGVKAKENDTSRAHCYRWTGMPLSG
jgi:hypothetical protein